MNSVEALFEKIDENISSINGILDFLKDSEKDRKKETSTRTEKKSAAAAAGTSNDMLKGFSLKDISENIMQLSKGLVAFSRAESLGAPGKFVQFLKDLQGVLTDDGALSTPDQIAKKYEAIGTGIKGMGEGLAGFAWGLIVFAIPAKLKLDDLFIKFVEKMFSPSLMDKLQPEKAEQVGDALSALATGILKFSGYLMLATVAMVVGLPGLLLIIPAIYLVMSVMSKFADQSDKISEGADAIQKLALGLLIFTGAVIMSRFVQPMDLLMAAGVVLVFGLFVLMLGLVGKLVGGGMDGLKDAGMGVIALAGGLVVFTLAIILMRFVEWQDIFKALLVTVVFSLLVMLLGESKDAKTGAIAFLIIAASTAVLALTIQMFADIEWETIFKASTSIGVVALAVYLVGQNAMKAIVGAISVMIVAASVGVLGYMLKTWQDFGITDETLIQVGLAIGGITVALVALGLVGVMVMVGAAALAIVALSLTGSMIMLAYALQKFKDIGWTEDDNDILASTMITVPSAMTMGFLRGGGPLLLFAVPALAMASLALYPIVSALSDFKKSGVTEDDAEMAGDVVTGFIAAVREPIEELGKSAGFFTKSDFARGVDSLRGIGNVTAEIAAGVLAASKLEYKSLTGKVVKITPSDFSAVGSNVAAMIDALKEPFIEIGKDSSTEAEKMGGIFAAISTGGISLLFPKDTDFRRGMKSVSGIGALLSEIAKGVLDMASMEFRGLDGKIRKITTSDFTSVGNNVTEMINALKAPISEIGMASAKADTGIFGAIFGDAMFANIMSLPADAYFMQGMEAVGGLGGLISGIASGVKDLAAGEFTDPEHPDGPKLTALDMVPKVANVVKKMIEGLAAPISEIGMQSQMMDTGVLGWFLPQEMLVGNDTRALKYAGFKEGMEALGGLGGLLSGIANAVKTFGSGKIPDPSDPSGKTFISVNTVVPNMIKTFLYILSSLTKPIIAIGTLMPKEVMDAATDRFKQYDKIVKSMSGIVKSAGAVVTEYAAIKDFDKNLVASMKAVNGAAAVLFANKVFAQPKDVAQFDRMVKGVVKIAEVSDKLTSAATAMKSISESLVKVFTSMNTVMETKFAAVATLMEKLVEVDRVDAESLQKKIDAYKDYIALVKTIDTKTVEAIKQMESTTSATMETTMKDIATALKELATKVSESNSYLKSIKLYTGMEVNKEK